MDAAPMETFSTTCILATPGRALPAAGLLAAGWEQVVIAMVAIGIWAVNQFLGARNKPAPPVARRNLPPAAPGQPAGGQKGLLDEVEQFLKDARKQMEQQQQRPQPQQPRPQPRIQPPPILQQPGAQTRKPKPPPKPKQKSRQPGRPLSETRPLDDVREGNSVEQHVREHLGTDRFDTSAFDERAGKLSHLTQTIDQDIGAHVRSVFDHQVGTISTTAAPVEAPAAPTPAQHLVAMLRDPQGVRNAIVLQEILKPPVERW
jgi:hypothetical protein